MGKGKKQKQAETKALAVTSDGAPVQKSFWGDSWANALYGGGTGLTTRNHDLTFTEQGAATAFAIIVEVQRAVMFIADSIAMLPAGIYDSRTDERILSLDARQLDPNKPGATFIAAVRSYERRWMHNFIESIVFSDWLYGESFVKRLVNPLGGVTGVRWLNPLYVEPYIQQGRIQYYRYMPYDGDPELQRDPIKPSEMAFRIHHRNPREDLRGESPVLSALNSMNIERNAERGVISYFRNGMVLGGVMMPEGETTMWNDPQINRIRTDMRQHHEGVDNNFRWVIAPSRVSFETFDQPDLDKNYKVVEYASKKIMMALGVPPELAGDPTSLKYDNAADVMRNWLLVNGKAYASKLAGFINTSLLSFFEPDADCYFKFDFTEVDRKDAALVQADYGAGFITINEARAERGYKADDRLNNIVVIGGKPINIDLLEQLSKDVTAFTGQPPAPQLPVYSPDAMTIPGQVNPPPALPEPEPQKGAASLWVGLSLANNPDLIDLQKRLKALYPDPGIKWNDPAEFHITLLYVPAVEDDQVNELVPSLDLAPDDLELKVGSLACFDNVGEHALHFKVARNSALLDMQSSLYDLCEGMGLQPSGYSRPAQYTPHITMGYLPEKSGRIVFHGKVRVTPVDVICSVERGGENETVWQYNAPEVEAAATEDEPEANKAIAVDHDGHTHEIPAITWDWSKDKAREELKTWQRFAQRGKHQRPFAFEYLRGKYADEVTALVEQGNAPADVVKAVTEHIGVSGIEWMRPAFDAALRALASDDHDAAIKSIDSIRGDFESRFGAVVADMQAGDLSSRQRAGNIIRQLLRMFGARAYRQGLEDAGVDDTPDEEEQAEINSLLSEQSGFVSSLTTAMINEGISQAQADGKAQLWFNGGISPLYSAGLMAGNKNIMLEFVLGGAEQHCEDCPRLAKQVHRAREWKKRNLDGIPRVGQATECEGWRCLCKLVPTTAKASGSW